MEIENPKDLVELREEEQVEDREDGQEEERDELKISFLTVIFVQDAIITAGDEGCLYVWDDKKINKK